MFTLSVYVWNHPWFAHFVAQLSVCSLMSQNSAHSQTEESFTQSAQYNGSAQSIWTNLRKYIPCISDNRRVQPLVTTTGNSNFVLLRKHCNYHVVHVLAYGTREPKGKFDLRFAAKVSQSRFWTGQVPDEVDGIPRISTLQESKDYESDSSLDDYWFAQWTVPIRTVKKLRKEHEGFERNREVAARVSARNSEAPKVFGPASKTRSMYNVPSVTSVQPNNNLPSDGEERNEKSQIESFATQQSLQIIQRSTEQASALVPTIHKPATEVASILETRAQPQNDEIDSKASTGHVNPAFVGSEINPDGYCSTVPNVEQAVLQTSSNTQQESFRISKPSHKPVLFFIHGLGGSASQWTVLINYFNELGYEVVAPDLLGHGLSSAPDIRNLYTFRNLLSDLDQIFSAHMTDGRKSVIVGHGYGCAFAAALTRQRISQVSLLVLMSCGSPTILAPPIRSTLPDVLINCLQPCLMCGLKKESLYSARGKNMMHGNHYHLPAHVKDHISAGQSWPEGDVAYHRRISIPTLLIYGLKDPHVSLVEMCEMERTIPRAFLELVPNAGHAVMVDAAEAVCKMVGKFLDHWER